MAKEQKKDNAQSRQDGYGTFCGHFTIRRHGSQLMTQAERNAHRSKLRKMKTEQEREAYRLEHHTLMQERAKAKGITLPAEPPVGGAGPGAGLGGGAGGPGGNR